MSGHANSIPGAKNFDGVSGPMTAVRRVPAEFHYRTAFPIWKRAMDVCGAALGLGLLSPLFLLIALYIKAVSKGPVFFAQERIGRWGRRFVMWKFRTMHACADSSAHREHMTALIQSDGASSKPMQKLDEDMPLLPLGGLLRKTCIDELPQLWNVLTGAMSLVGPRPMIPYEVQEYRRWHWARLDACPGMTGLWQVSGKNSLTFSEMIRLDIRYERNRCFILDIKILAKTFPVIAKEVRTWLRKKARGADND